MCKVPPRYEIQRLLGEGGMGRVYLAEDRETGRRVALKFLRPIAGVSTELLREEVRLLRRLSHPQLVRVWDYHEEGASLCSSSEAEGPISGPCFSMEYVEGSPFDRACEGQTPEVLRDYLLQAAKGLQYLHALRLLHRDLKPANLLVTNSGKLKLVDFGLAGLEAPGAHPEQPRGTLAYLPPEAYFGNYETRSDLFSLGVLAYEALTGRLPYEAFPPGRLDSVPKPPSLQSLRPDLPGYFGDWIHRLLELSPARRFASATGALRYLERQIQSPGTAPATELGAELDRPSFVDRKQEMSACRERLHRAFRERQPCRLEIEGPTGVGRSRFLEEMKWELQLEGVAFEEVGPARAETWCQAAEAPGSWLSAMQQFLEQAPSRGLVLACSDLQGWTEAARKRLQVFLSLMSASKVALGAFLEWNAERAGADFLEFSSSLESGNNRLRMTLGDLGPEASRELLASVAPEMPPAKTETIIRLSGGRPLLLLELLQSGPGELASLGDWSEVARAKVARLTAEAQALLALVVEHPEAVNLAEARSLWEGSEERWEDALLELDQAGFLRQRDLRHPWLDLAQPSLRKFFSEALPPERRAWSHRRWIESLLAKLGSRPQALPGAVALADHAFQAGEKGLAKAWGLAAAEFFESRLQAPEALNCYRRLLPWAETPEERYTLWGSMAPLLYRLGKLEEALAAYERWFQDRPDDETFLQKTRYGFFTGMVLYTLGRADEARQRLEGALAASRAESSAEHRLLHARSLAFLAALEEKKGDAAAAQRHLQRARDIAVGEPGLLGEIEQRLGELEQHALNYEAAARHFQEARLQYAKTRNPQTEALAIQGLAMLYRECGRAPEALALQREALEFSKRAGQVLQWARYAENLGLLFLDLGDYGHAQASMEGARPVLEALGTPQDRILIRLHRVQLLTQVGDFERAAAELEVLERRGAELEALGLTPALAIRNAELAYAQGRFAEAEAVFAECQKAAERDRHRGLAWTAAVGRCRSLVRAGRLIPEQEPLRGTLSGLEALPGLLFPLWKEALTLLSLPAAEWTPLRWSAFAKQILSLPLPAQRIELRILLGLHLRRLGLAQAARRCRALAAEDWQKIHSQLPEELKMDFEKRNDLGALDQELDRALETPAATPPSPTAEPLRRSASKISEQRFRQFSEISRQIARTNDLEATLEKVMDAAVLLTGAERGFLLLRNGQAKQQALPGFEVKTARNLSHQSLQQEDFQISLSAVKQALEQSTTLLTGNAQLDPRLQDRRSVVQYQLKAILVVPLELDGKMLGAIYLDHRYRPDCFQEEDIVLLSAFAAQASLAIQKAQLISDLQEAKLGLERKVENQSQRIQVLTGELSKVREELRYGYDEIIGRSKPMMEVFGLLDHVTDTMIPVWIHGESGTGKELVARSLHFNSSRKSGPFVTENCSAIPETLLESELFGHKKGAFTHADRDRAGLFEQASGGTLFLDEVADMPMNMQVKLLRVLQEGEVRPVGSSKKVKVDVRLVTASNKDLEALVAEEKFRQDLFFRVNGLTLRLPPLRERREDIPLLINYFLQKIARDFKLKESQLSDQAFQMLMEYPWPGNIRQLEAVLRNALLFARGRPITPAHLSLGRETRPASAEKPGASAAAAMPAEKAREEERQLILDSLRKNRMNKRLSAEALGISLRSLYIRMDRFGIPKSKPVLAKYLGLKA